MNADKLREVMANAGYSAEEIEIVAQRVFPFDRTIVVPAEPTDVMLEAARRYCGKTGREALLCAIRAANAAGQK